MIKMTSLFLLNLFRCYIINNDERIMNFIFLELFILFYEYIENKIQNKSQHFFQTL
jgi:hypothetical protein